MFLTRFQNRLNQRLFKDYITVIFTVIASEIGKNSICYFLGICIRIKFILDVNAANLTHNIQFLGRRISSIEE
jgi:hypothetical protein